jgi:phosphoenolpyruvate carboxylase
VLVPDFVTSPAPAPGARRSTDTQRPLRRDIRELGSLLGETLRELGDQRLLDTVEEVRALSKQARGGNPEAFEALEARLRTLPVQDALPIARAFSHFLTLANIAEQHHRIRRRRHYQGTERSPQEGSFRDTFARLIGDGVSPDEMFSSLCAQQVEIVLTAHPTEVVRRTLRQIQRRIATLLAWRDRPDLTRAERDASRGSLHREIATAWLTDEIRHHRPTPIDEAKWGLVVFEQTLWDAVPTFHRGLDRALREATSRELPLNVAPVRFGSWIGGDRDGNPYVTAAVTRQACLLARWMAADLYYREFRRLRSELPLANGSAELRKRVGNAREPYRALLRSVCDRLADTRRGLEALLSERDLPEDQADRMVWTANDLVEPLELCARSLRETGAGVLVDGALRDLLTRLACFGVTLVKLDIRQEATRHTNALSAITRSLGLGSYKTWEESERQTFLCRALQDGGRSLTKAFSPGAAFESDVQEILDVFRCIAALPPESLGAYVISMASRPSDVLCVQLLQAAAGVRPQLRVVPLFETVSDLRSSGDCVRELLRIPEYRERAAGRQEIMIGYSDSAKDGGRLAAAWELFRAQEAIAEACRQEQVELTFFHGRGGTIGRGGGPIELAVQAQPPGAQGRSVRITAQGEMIDFEFGLPDIALRNLEVYTTATLTGSLRPSGPPPPAWRSRMQDLADASRRAFHEMVHESDRFVEYFRAATPERELAELKIASRPQRRSSGSEVAGLRAIPWVFAWTQTRLLLPAWLGVGEALQKAVDAGQGSEIQAMYQEWPFFRATIDLIEMVLAKSSPQISARYDAVLVPTTLREMGDELRKRLEQTIQMVLFVTQHRRLLAHNQVLQRSIEVRNPYVDPINVVQIELLRRVRAAEDRDDLMNALLVTVNGIAAGMRNTG